MSNFNLHSEEVILYEGIATSKEYKGNLQLTLTSQKVILEKEKGHFKKERELIDIVFLENVKFYNNIVQVNQKGNSVKIQTVAKNITLSFSGLIEARKFTEKIVEAITGTTLTKRVFDKTNEAFNMIDETFGVDIRGTIKGLQENGVKGTILDGILKKK